jgi:hypothetical protein
MVTCCGMSAGGFGSRACLRRWVKSDRMTASNRWQSATDSEGLPTYCNGEILYMRELFLGVIPLGIGLYFLFHHAQFMAVVEWLARLVH